MQPPRDLPNAHSRFLSFIRFAVSEGWEAFRSRTGNLRVLKARLPPVHIGLAVTSTTAEIEEKRLSDKSLGGTGKQGVHDA